MRDPTTGTVSVRELKDHLSEHLRRVQRGQHILVTDQGHPIAEIMPLRRESMTLDERLARLQDAGEITLPQIPFATREAIHAEFLPARRLPII